MLEKNTTDDDLKYFSYLLQENKLWHFTQIVSSGDNLHEMLNLFSGKSKKNIIN